MRVFVAIDIDEQTRAALGNLQRKLSDEFDIRPQHVKWTQPEAIHLTLKFLGSVKDKDIAGVCDAVRLAAQSHKSFRLELESVGCFGGKSARVLWAGTTKGTDKLKKLQQDIEKQLALLGLPEEKRDFHGHLTLCRIKNYKAGMILANAAEEYKDSRFGSIVADSVVVYESKLTSAGPIYTALDTCMLR